MHKNTYIGTVMEESVVNLKALKKNELDFILQYYKKEDIEKLPAKYIAGFLWNLFA